MTNPTEKQKQEWLKLAKFFLDEHGVDFKEISAHIRKYMPVKEES